MSYYLTLSSNVQRGEFPDNDSSEFRGRLPENRVWNECPDDKWEVGLSGVSFPDSPPSPPQQEEHSESLLVHEDYYHPDGRRHPSTWNEEGYLCTFYYTTLVNGSIARNVRGVMTLTNITPSKAGVEFVKKVVDAMEQEIVLSLRTGEVLHIDWTDSEGNTHKKKTVATLRWDGEDLILDNTEVYISGVMWMYFGWVFELSQNMGWLESVKSVDRSTPGRYCKGPNTRLIPFDPKGPWADYTQETFSDASVFPGHANDFSSGLVTVVTEGTGWSIREPFSW